MECSSKYNNKCNNRFLTTYACWLSPTVFYIPYTDGQECELEVQSDADNFNWDSVQFYVLDLEVLAKCSNMATTKAVSDVNWENGDISTSVQDATENERIFISVPVDEDWNITINWEEAEIELIGDCLYSIKLKEGTNTIEMKYHICYLKAGICITSLTLLGYIAYILYKKHNKKTIN